MPSIPLSPCGVPLAVPLPTAPKLPPTPSLPDLIKLFAGISLPTAEPPSVCPLEEDAAEQAALAAASAGA